MFFSGVIYTWSIIKVPLITELGWKASSVNITYTLLLGFFCIGALLNGYLSDKIKSVYVIVSSALLAALGFIFTSMLNGGPIILLYLSYGLMCGIGIGASYTMILTLINSWFPEKRGFCSGVLMMSYGLSTFILGKVADKLINTPVIGWRKTYIIIGIAVFISVGAAGLILKVPDETAANSTLNQVKQNIASYDYSPKEVVKRSSFWLLFITLMLMTTLGSGIYSSGKELMSFIGASSSFATTAVGILALSNGFGRILIGIVCDKLGFIKTKLLAGILSVIAAGVVVIAILTGSVVIGVIGFILTGLSYGCCPTLLSFTCSSFYGTKYFAGNLSILNLHIMFGSIMAPVFTLLRENTGGYLVPSAIILGAVIISLILNISVRKA